MIFDIINGETAFLGTIALSEPPRNRARNRHLEPILGVDQNTEHANVSPDQEASLVITELEDTEFDPDAGICTNTRYDVAGWTPRQP
ncbi:MAG: hypothetical protein ABJG15_07250 [Hyphomonadaceae bacterium]